MAITITGVRWRRGIAAGGAVLLLALIGFSGAPLRLVNRFLTATPTTDVLSLPDRVRPTPALHPSMWHFPAGPASMVYGGEDWPSGLFSLDDEASTLAVAGGRAETYRSWTTVRDMRAGQEVLLSPDGRLLAYPGSADDGLVLDLGTGKRALRRIGTYPGPVRPLTWSPDGSRLVVASGDRLGLIHVPGGGFTDLAEIPQDTPLLAGYAAAFAPDGSRLAYQLGREVVVTRLDGDGDHRFTLPRGHYLAGKGAWTPDGSGLVTLREGRDTWPLSTVDAVTGRTVAASRWTPDAGLSGVRLIGWDRAGDPVVVAYRPHPGVGVADGRSDQPVTEYGAVKQVEVLALREAGTARPVLAAERGVASIDIAEDVLTSGVTRPADPPRIGPLSVLCPATLLAVAVVVLYRRRRAG